MCFTNLIFEKILDIASEKGIRFVALNRRHYPGSTLSSAEELAIVFGEGTEEQKDAELQRRGTEIGIFINNFIVQHQIPPISKDNNSGGIILLGWSLGSATALATIASADSLPKEMLARLGAYIKSVIVYDPSPIVFGLPTPENSWTPLLDTHILEDLRLPAFGHWASGYFDHGDLTKRDPRTLSWVVPSSLRVPTFFNIPAAKYKQVAHFGSDGSSDLRFMINFMKQSKAAYRKAFYDPQTFIHFPRLQPTVLAGGNSGAFAIAGIWAIEADQKEIRGEKRLKIKLVPGINHFLSTRIDILVNCRLTVSR